MTKRAGKKYPPDPDQWYIEPEFTPRQLFEALDFGGGVIWDPCCGRGTTLDAAKSKGYRTFGSDIRDRGSDHQFRQADFLKTRFLPFRPGDLPVSIVTNPPYGKVGGSRLMGEKIIYHALEHFLEHCVRLAFILPIEFSCGQDRYWDLYSKNEPSHILTCSQRPSMPPGQMVEDMGDDAFKGGIADYCVIVWSKDFDGGSRWLRLKPDDSSRPERRPRRIK